MLPRFNCLIVIWLTGGIVLSASSQLRNTSHLWSATLTIVDDEGSPVPNAKTSISFYTAPASDEVKSSDIIQGLSDTNGIFTATHSDRSVFLGLRSEKEKYYSAFYEYNLGFDEDASHSVWAFNKTLILARKLNPIPMYAREVNLGLPAFDKAVGYDLIAGDWVAPYGKGSTSDLIFVGHFNKQDSSETDYVLTLSFSNPADGIQESVTKPEKYIGLRSLHEAPTLNYQSQWIQTDQRMKHRSVTSRDASRIYYFRVRSQTDVDGKIKSALYGKIYGDFMAFIYYLNPKPNDTNIEFDPKNNLFKSQHIAIP